MLESVETVRSNNWREARRTSRHGSTLNTNNSFYSDVATNRHFLQGRKHRNVVDLMPNSQEVANEFNFTS